MAAILEWNEYRILDQLIRFLRVGKGNDFVMDSVNNKRRDVDLRKSFRTFSSLASS